MAATWAREWVLDFRMLLQVRGPDELS